MYNAHDFPAIHDFPAAHVHDFTAPHVFCCRTYIPHTSSCFDWFEELWFEQLFIFGLIVRLIKIYLKTVIQGLTWFEQSSLFLSSVQHACVEQLAFLGLPVFSRYCNLSNWTSPLKCFKHLLSQLLPCKHVQEITKLWTKVRLFCN
jgi:hypothetical protein